MIVGLDISKLKMDACMLTPKGKVKKCFPNSPRGADELYAWTQARFQGDENQKVPSIILEPTGTYHTLPAVILQALGSRIFPVNPFSFHQLARALGSTKTDGGDAEKLAEGAALLPLQEWTPPPDSVLELRELVKRLLAVVEHIKRENLRLEEQPRVVCWLGVRSSLLRSRAWHEAERKELQKTIEAFYTVEAHAPLRADRDLVRTIPGVGPQAADHLLCLLRMRTLNSAREAAALAGVIPVHRQSGSSVNGNPRISHEGDKRVRSGLYMPTLSACTHDPVFRAHYQALISRGKPKKAALVACMHRLVRVAYGVLRHRAPYEPARAYPVAACA